jgi:hypothetical protein
LFATYLDRSNLSCTTDFFPTLIGNDMNRAELNVNYAWFGDGTLRWVRACKVRLTLRKAHTPKIVNDFRRYEMRLGLVV